MFFLQPWKLDSIGRPDRSLATANVALIAANVLAFMCGGYLPAGAHQTWIHVLLYGFSHAGLWHLAANMWALWIFGNPINRRLGNQLYLAAYLGTVIALGLLARSCISIPVVGSSGALFAVIALAVLLEPNSVLQVACCTLFPLTAIIGVFAPPASWWQWIARYKTCKIPLLYCLAMVPLFLLWEFLCLGWNWATTAHLIGLACGVLAILILPKHVTMSRRFAAM